MSLSDAAACTQLANVWGNISGLGALTLRASTKAPALQQSLFVNLVGQPNADGVVDPLRTTSRPCITRQPQASDDRDGWRTKDELASLADFAGLSIAT
jgi:hypothetical protein